MNRKEMAGMAEMEVESPSLWLQSVKGETLLRTKWTICAIKISLKGQNINFCKGGINTTMGGKLAWWNLRKVIIWKGHNQGRLCRVQQGKPSLGS